MTGQQKESSQFTQRADSAALKLKDMVSKQRGIELQSKQVEVGPDGQPLRPPPPEGSYMRQMFDQQQAAQQQQQQIGDQPPAGTVEHAVDGSQAPPVAPPEQPPQEADSQLSDRAQQRFSELTAQLRQKDQELQQALERLKTNDSTSAELQAKLEALQQQHEQMLQANLENLDPEVRMQVMQDARMRELMSGMERRIMDTLMPHIQGLEQQTVQTEMMQLSKRYPAFDIQIHGPLIDMYRGKNPHSSIEQAFKAVAEPEELITRQAASATAVPPVVPPGSGSPMPKYTPEPESNPEQEMIEEAARVRELMRSDKPADHKAGLRLADKNIADRLRDSVSFLR